MAICAACGLFLAALGGYMALTGRGSSLIAGFNMMSDDEKSRYDAARLCRFVGKFLALVGILTVMLAAALALSARYGVPHESVITVTYSLLVAGGSVFVAVYANTGGRFKK